MVSWYGTVALFSSFVRRIAGIALCGLLVISRVGAASDASSKCKDDVGLRFELNVVSLDVDSIKYKMSIENVSGSTIRLSKDLVPWLNPGFVSVALLDWKSGGALENWFDESRLKFTLGGREQKKGAFFSRYVMELMASVDGVLKPGQSLSSSAELSSSPPDFPLAGNDFERLRREGVFLWTARVGLSEVECLQSGISKIE